MNYVEAGACFSEAAVSATARKLNSCSVSIWVVMSSAKANAKERESAVDGTAYHDGAPF